MTAIAAVIGTDGTVTMGGDSAVSNPTSGDLVLMADAKVVRVGEFLVGLSGDCRPGDVVRFFLEPKRYNPARHGSEYTYVANVWSHGLRETMRAHGALIGGPPSGEPEQMGSDLLVAFRGKLYHVYPDFSVNLVAKPYAAVGCGGPYVLGALYATDGQPPTERVRKALEAAEAFNAFVRAPFVIEQLPLPHKPRKT